MHDADGGLAFSATDLSRDRTAPPRGARRDLHGRIPDFPEQCSV